MFIVESYYEEMLECGISDMKDDYDFKNEVSYSENKQNEKKKSKSDVSLIISNIFLFAKVLIRFLRICQFKINNNTI